MSARQAHGRDEFEEFAELGLDVGEGLPNTDFKDYGRLGNTRFGLLDEGAGNPGLIRREFATADVQVCEGV